MLGIETELLLFLVVELGESREKDKLCSVLQEYFCVFKPLLSWILLCVS